MWSHYQNNLIQFMKLLHVVERYVKNEKEVEMNPTKTYMF